MSLAKDQENSNRQELADLSSDMVGFWKSYTIYAAVRLKVPDFLPGTTEQISLDTKIPTEKLERLLRALWEIGIVETQPKDVWTLTKKGHLLKPTSSSYMAAAAKMWIESNLELWSNLVTMLQTFDNKVVPYFQNLKHSAEKLKQYHHALEGYAQQDYRTFKDLINWNQHKKVLDIGCGSGSLLTQVLQTNTHLTGVFVDLPEVIKQLKLPTNLKTRVELLGQDFFKPWTSFADAIILSRILHDWPDKEASQILRYARQSLSPGGFLYIVEMLTLKDDPQGSLLDLNMLVATGGNERNEEQWGSLLDTAGFKIVEIKKLSNITSVIIGAVA